MTRDELIADARQHCEGCPKCERLNPGSVVCEGKMVPMSVGRCPDGLWDHSTPQPVVVRKTRERTATLCKERLSEEWGEEWQAKILAAVIRETAKKYVLPIALYEEALKNRK